MKKIRVMQQALDPTGYGGVSVEYRSLMNSADLGERYEFIPLILNDFHKGVNLKDISFYYQAIKKEHPDIVHVRGATVDGLNAEIAAKLVRGTKLVVCIHGMYSDMVNINPIKKKIAKYIIEPLCFGLADGISCVYKKCSKRTRFSKYQKKMLPHVYNRIPDYAGVITEEKRLVFRKKYGLKPDDTVCLFCGRITRDKGLTYLLEAFKKLDTTWPDKLNFLIVGDGDYRQDFESEVNRLNNKGKVHFIGALSDVTPALSAADFFILPSLHENHSIALLEAMAAALPTIATNVGGNSEIVKDHVFGQLIKKADSEEMCTAIIEFCDDELLNCYKKAIQEYSFDEFSSENADRQLDEVYRQALSK